MLIIIVTLLSVQHQLTAMCEGGMGIAAYITDDDTSAMMIYDESLPAYTYARQSSYYLPYWCTSQLLHTSTTPAYSLLYYTFIVATDEP